MPKLVLMHDGAVIREYPLNKERITVGRRPNNDIQLDDQTVSGTHAIFLVLHHVYVEDQNSTNGVLLNGKRVGKRQLEHGDMVRIGRHELKFIDDKAQDFERTVIISPGASTHAAPASPAASPAAGTAASSPEAAVSSIPMVVRVVAGPKNGTIIELKKPYTTLGNPGGEMAVIARRGSRFFLMQMQGTASNSPPRLNGELLRAQSQVLTLGDIIEVAGSRLQFEASASE
ncbi:MAG: FHA domain-containing protein [Gammaproteobacteria bacterium]